MGRIVEIFKLPNSCEDIVKIEFKANDQMRVKELALKEFKSITKRPLETLGFVVTRVPRVGDGYTLCYNPKDANDMAFEGNNKFDCPDAGTKLAVYLVHFLMLSIPFLVNYLAALYDPGMSAALTSWFELMWDICISIPFVAAALMAYYAHRISAWMGICIVAFGLAYVIGVGAIGDELLAVISGLTIVLYITYLFCLG